MHFAPTKHQQNQSEDLTTVIDTKLTSRTSSTSPIAETPTQTTPSTSSFASVISDRIQNIENSNLICIAEAGDYNNSQPNIIATTEQRPKKPPRPGKLNKIATTTKVPTIAVAKTTATSLDTQTLMIKSIENLPNHANDGDDEKNEEKEEKEPFNEQSTSSRRNSKTDDAGTVNTNKNQTQTHEPEAKQQNKACPTRSETVENLPATATTTKRSSLEVTDGGVLSALTAETTNSSNSTATQIQSADGNEFNEKNNVISAITPPVTAPAAVERQTGEVDKIEKVEQSNSVGVVAAKSEAAALLPVSASSSNTGGNSHSRNNSASGLGKTKLTKTPSFTKISNSLQSSLGAFTGSNRADEDTISKSSDTSGELIRGVVTESGISDKPKSGASRLSERAKKKSWYNVLYPNYKSRADDFKKLFKEVPSEERLIVDYSCALQRDILVQGRLYVSQNYVCFHANIFRWETYLSIRWKDVTSITKEKTALVIPNAISICTAKEKYFFATFATRDKTFLMLFRVWQNTLMNKQMPPQEIWQWVHNCYGDELGLTSDDEDYIDPSTKPTTANLDYENSDFELILPQEETASIFSSALGSDYSTAQSTQNFPPQQAVLSSSASSGAGVGISTVPKTRRKSYFFGGGGKVTGNCSSSTTATTTSTSGSDNNKASDYNSGECETIDKMNAKELTLTTMKPELSNSANESGGSGASGASRETKSSTLKASTTHDAKRKMPKTTRERDEAASNNQTNLPTDASGSSDSEESKVPFIATAECNSPHEGRQLVHTILPINVDTLFSMLFSKSKFFTEFHAMRKSENMSFGDWLTDGVGKKTRIINLTVQLLASVGPKVSKVTEVQEMRECSKPGELYSIDVTSVNAGIPYADSFNVLMHYCLVRTVDDHTMLSVHAQVKYKKSIWGVVKGFIEKNTWAGLEEYYGALQKALQSETCIPPAKAKGRRPRRGTTAQIRPTEDAPNEAQVKAETSEVGASISRRGGQTAHLPVAVVEQSSIDAEPQNKHKWLSIFVIALLFSLIALNVILLFKLWSLEERIEKDISQRARIPNLAMLQELPHSNQEWVELLRQQEILHETELKKWHKVLQTAIELLKKTEQTLAGLMFR